MSFNSTKLSNGINVLTYSMPRLNSVNISIIIKIGSRYETLDESGINNLLTEMAFKGTKNHSAMEISQKFKLIGGYHYAFSDREYSIYACKVLINCTEEGLTLLTDSLFNSEFDEKDIKKELKNLSKNDNICLPWSKIYKVAYGEHPLSREDLITKNNIAIYDTKILQDYVAKHYNANNIDIIMVGNIEQNEAIALTEKLFPKPDIVKKSNYLPAKYTGGCYQKETNLEITDIALGFESNAYVNIKEFYQEIMLSKILQSRLLKKINTELDLDCHINVLVSTLKDSGLFQIMVSTDQDNAKILLQNIILEINKIKTNIQEDELEQIKTQTKSSMSIGQDDPDSREHHIVKNFNLFGKYFSQQEIIDVISTITISDLTLSAQRLFSGIPSLAITGSLIKDFDFESVKNDLLR